MSDEEVTPSPFPARVGSNADLARRMDRMEGRQDAVETEVRTLTATVARVELNQQHSSELQKLRFDALDSGMKSGFAELTGFQARIEGILDGSIQTNQTRQGQEIVADFIAWRKKTDSRLDTIEDYHLAKDASKAGVNSVFTGTKGVVLMLAAVASPLIAAVAVIWSHL